MRILADENIPWWKSMTSAVVFCSIVCCQLGYMIPAKFLGKRVHGMKGQAIGSLAQWLEERCRKERLSLRKAAAKTGLSNNTIADIMKGTHASAETIGKLAHGFGGEGANQRLALEDELLVLAGYRTKRPEGEELSEALAQVMDKARQFDERQLKIMLRFADFISEMRAQ